MTLDIYGPQFRDSSCYPSLVKKIAGDSSGNIEIVIHLTS